MTDRAASVRPPREIYSKRNLMARRKPTFDIKKEVRKLARQRVGTTPAARPIQPKSARRKPKHKRLPGAGDDGPA